MTKTLIEIAKEKLVAYRAQRKEAMQTQEQVYQSVLRLEGAITALEVLIKMSEEPGQDGTFIADQTPPNG